MVETSSSSELEAYLLQLDQQKLTKACPITEISSNDIVIRLNFTSFNRFLTTVWSSQVYIVVLLLEGVILDSTLFLYLLAILHHEDIKLDIRIQQLKCSISHHIYRLVVIFLCSFRLFPLHTALEFLPRLLLALPIMYPILLFAVRLLTEAYQWRLIESQCAKLISAIEYHQSRLAIFSRRRVVPVDSKQDEGVEVDTEMWYDHISLGKVREIKKKVYLLLHHVVEEIPCARKITMSSSINESSQRPSVSVSELRQLIIEVHSRVIEVGRFGRLLRTDASSFYSDIVLGMFQEVCQRFRCLHLLCAMNSPLALASMLQDLYPPSASLTHKPTLPPMSLHALFPLQSHLLQELEDRENRIRQTMFIAKETMRLGGIDGDTEKLGVQLLNILGEEINGNDSTNNVKVKKAMDDMWDELVRKVRSLIPASSRVSTDPRHSTLPLTGDESANECKEEEKTGPAADDSRKHLDDNDEEDRVEKADSSQNIGVTTKQEGTVVFTAHTLPPSLREAASHANTQNNEKQADMSRYILRSIMAELSGVLQQRQLSDKVTVKDFDEPYLTPSSIQGDSPMNPILALPTLPLPDSVQSELILRLNAGTGDVATLGDDSDED